MLHLYCPHCEEHREEDEFHYRGQAHIVRPKDPESLSDEAWGNYVSRDTVTYKIHESYKIGEQPAVKSESDLA